MPPNVRVRGGTRKRSLARWSETRHLRRAQTAQLARIPLPFAYLRGPLIVLRCVSRCLDFQARQSIVLLKNGNEGKPVLPLANGAKVAIAVSTDGRKVCRPDEEIVRYFADDVDRPGLLQCANWGARELSPQQKETFRFLQVVDAGDGTSGRVAQGVLNYARRLGGDGLLLPRSIKRCWQILDQVQCCTKLLNSQFKFKLQILQFKFILHLTILNVCPCGTTFV